VREDSGDGRREMRHGDGGGDRYDLFLVEIWYFWCGLIIQGLLANVMWTVGRRV
jgi:hypothetical protein